MKIKINKILDLESREKERIVLDVMDDCNLGSYIIALSDKIDDNTISSKLENVFWLKDCSLKRGDIVVIYTNRQGNGIHSVPNSSGAESHFLFWNLGFQLGSNPSKKVVFFEATWSTFSIEKDNSDLVADGN